MLKMDLLAFILNFEEKNKKTMESVIYSIVQNVFGIEMICLSIVFLFFFEYQEYKMSIFRIYFIHA